MGNPKVKGDIVQAFAIEAFCPNCKIWEPVRIEPEIETAFSIIRDFKREFPEYKYRVAKWVKA